MRDAQLARAFLRLRSPLARVELAASRLARYATSPVARELVGVISDAVQEMDAEIAAWLRAVGRELDAERDPGDCRAVLAFLRERMAPVLGAHEVAWIDSLLPAPEAPFIADRATFGRGALVLLRAGIALCAPRGSFSLDLARDEDKGRLGLRLDARSPEGAVESAADPLAEPLAFARGCGGSLSADRRPPRVTATLWLSGHAEATEDRA